MVADIWQQAYFLPSVGEKKGRETYRLHFKRRHTVEKTNLYVVRASNLIFQLRKTISADRQEEKLKLFVNPQFVNFIAKLSAQNQVAILIDTEDPLMVDWVSQVLQTDLHLQVDAIYAFRDKFKPSMLLLDATQILNDFRLFSKFYQRYKQSQPDQSLFTFLEVAVSGAPIL